MDDFDPLGAHLHDPYPVYARARRTEPVFWSPRLRAWVVTRFADVDAILKDPAGFSSTNSLRPVRDLYPATLAALADGYPPTPDHITSDGDAHRRLRAPYARRLTLATVKALEPDIRARAEALARAWTGGDVIAGFASPLPVHTAALVFGIANDDIETARRGSESLFSLGSADLDEDAEAAAARDVVALQRLMAGYVRRRHAAPEDDLISDVVSALADTLGFEQEAEIVGTLCSTLGAGHITTTDTIGNALRVFLRHPDQWDLLRRRPDLVPNAVEEVLRFESPVPTIFRRATKATSVAGVDIPADADVLLVFASANRDEDRYPDPDRFDVTRTPSRHFGFGAGPHTCVGAPMARVQARVALGLLLERLPRLRADPDHPVRLKTSINVRGPLTLHLSPQAR